MLAAFCDRTPGRYDIEGDMDYGPNTGQSMLEIRIREDGTAIHNWCWHTDAGIEWTNASARPLADPADYDECMNDPSPAARYGCLVDAFGEGVDLPRCQ